MILLAAILFWLPIARAENDEVIKCRTEADTDNVSLLQDAGLVMNCDCHPVELGIKYDYNRSSERAINMWQFSKGRIRMSANAHNLKTIRFSDCKQISFNYDVRKKSVSEDLGHSHAGEDPIGVTVEVRNVDKLVAWYPEDFFVKHHDDFLFVNHLILDNVNNTEFRFQGQTSSIRSGMDIEIYRILVIALGALLALILIIGIPLTCKRVKRYFARKSPAFTARLFRTKTFKPATVDHSTFGNND